MTAESLLHPKKVVSVGGRSMSATVSYVQICFSKPPRSLCGFISIKSAVQLYTVHALKKYNSTSLVKTCFL